MIKGRFRHHSLTVKGDTAGIVAAAGWLRELAVSHGLSEERLFQLELCAEEVVTNIVTHSYERQSGEIKLDLLLDQDTATLTLIDQGPAFDPTFQAAPDDFDGIATAKVGGLGIHLVRQFAEEIRYERDGERNRFTFRIGAGLPVFRHGERRRDGGGQFPIARSDGTQIDASERGGADRRALGFVAETAIFHGVPFPQVNRILGHCEVRTFVPGEVLFQAGERHRCVLVAIEGRVEIHFESADSQFFVELGQGECVGEMSVADGKPNSAWVLGGSEGRVLVIPESVFLEEVLAVPRIARNLIVVMSARMRRNSQQIVEQLRAGLELEALQRELDVARRTQLSMLPVSPLFSGQQGISGQGFMRAARQVGGDFYDAFPLGDHCFFVAIGDVCGKGTPAALFMVRALTLLRSEALRGGADLAKRLTELATRCNEQLCESNGGQQFVTIFCAIIDVAAERIDYVNIGHNPPLLRYPGKAAFFLEQPRNPLAGLIPDLDFEPACCAFPAGSLLLLYTDGVTEAESGSGEMFGDDALAALFSSIDTVETVAESVDRIVQAVDWFADGFEQSDDITVLAVSS